MIRAPVVHQDGAGGVIPIDKGVRGMVLEAGADYIPASMAYGSQGEQ